VTPIHTLRHNTCFILDDRFKHELDPSARHPRHEHDDVMRPEN
jgi:hypothetical protein